MLDTKLIKQQNDCRDVVSRYSILRKQSTLESAGPCPFCGGTDRFRVFADHWFCRPGPAHCARKGDVIDLIVMIEKVDFKTACTMLDGGTLATTAAPRAPAPAKEGYKAAEWNEAYQTGVIADAQKALHEGKGQFAKQCRAYLADRGITMDTAKAFCLGSNGVSLPGTEGKRKEIAIYLPYYDRSGTLVAYKCRFTQDYTYTDKEGKEQTTNKTSRGNARGQCFGWQTIQGAGAVDVLFICEGEFNALSLWQVGAGRIDVLSVGSQTGLQTLPQDVIEFAKEYKHRIVWADEREFADKAALAIVAHSMKSPQGKDANDWLQAGKLAPLVEKMLQRVGATLPLLPGKETAAPAPKAEDKPISKPDDKPLQSLPAYIADHGAWRAEIELASRSEDPAKRRAGAKLYGYLSGAVAMNQKDFTQAVYELNGSLYYKVFWSELPQE